MRYQPPLPETIAQAAALAAEGKSQKDIAKVMGVVNQTVARWKKENPQTWHDARVARGRLKEKDVDAAAWDERIARATGLLATGKKRDEAAEILGVTAETLRVWEHDHAAIWNQHFDRAMERALSVVRAQAGTDAILDDPDAFLRRAEVCLKWSKVKGVDLFPGREGMTLTRFYAEHYQPMRLGDAAKITLEHHRAILRAWALFTGDPPLTEITATTLARFRDCVAKRRSIDRVSFLSPSTVHNHVHFIQYVFDKAGPAGYRNRDAVGLLDKVPYIKPPRPLHREVRIATPEQLSAMYLASASMTVPSRRLAPGALKPPMFWKLLIVLAYNTGLRKSTLFSLRMSDVRWEDCCLIVPAARTKTRRQQIIHLNAVTMAHLRASRTEREYLVRWCYSSGRYFYKNWHKLQDLAGIPRKSHIGLHNIRKATATALWELSPSAAQLTMGHTSARMTSNHYVQSGGIIGRALDAMPQPAAFLTIPPTETGVADGKLPLPPRSPGGVPSAACPMLRPSGRRQAARLPALGRLLGRCRHGHGQLRGGRHPQQLPVDVAQAAIRVRPPVERSRRAGLRRQRLPRVPLSA